MTRIARPIVIGIAAALALGACSGGSSKVKKLGTPTTAASTTKPAATTAPPATQTTQKPNAPAPVVGTNGVTVRFTSPNAGVITPKVTKQSETEHASSYGGVLFRLNHAGDTPIYGASYGDVYAALKTRPGWTATTISTDATWTPGGCAYNPSTIVGDRWLVSTEGGGGFDGRFQAINNEYFIRAYDMKNDTYTVITAITATTRQRWMGPVWSISPNEVAIVGSHDRPPNSTPPFEEDTIRIINLNTMAFRDEPYAETKVPSKPAKPSTIDEPYETVFLPISRDWPGENRVRPTDLWYLWS